MFFYQNEYGSRVFFDHLGPPWPKHPCTDSASYNLKSLKLETVQIATSSKELKSPEVPQSGEVQGWIACEFLKFKYEDDRVILYFEEVESGEFRRSFVEERIEISKHLPFFILPWDAQGRAEIEFLDRDLDVVRIQTWRYALWFDREFDA